MRPPNGTISIKSSDRRRVRPAGKILLLAIMPLIIFICNIIIDTRIDKSISNVAMAQTSDNIRISRTLNGESTYMDSKRALEYYGWQSRGCISTESSFPDCERPHPLRNGDGAMFDVIPFSVDVSTAGIWIFEMQDWTARDQQFQNMTVPAEIAIYRRHSSCIELSWICRKDDVIDGNGFVNHGGSVGVALSPGQYAMVVTSPEMGRTGELDYNIEIDMPYGGQFPDPVIPMRFCNEITPTPTPTPQGCWNCRGRAESYTLEGASGVEAFLWCDHPSCLHLDEGDEQADIAIRVGLFIGSRDKKATPPAPLECHDPITPGTPSTEALPPGTGPTMTPLPSITPNGQETITPLPTTTSTSIFFPSDTPESNQSPTAINATATIIMSTVTSTPPPPTSVPTNSIGAETDTPTPYAQVTPPEIAPDLVEITHGGAIDMAISSNSGFPQETARRCPSPRESGLKINSEFGAVRRILYDPRSRVSRVMWQDYYYIEETGLILLKGDWSRMWPESDITSSDTSKYTIQHTSGFDDFSCGPAFMIDLFNLNGFLEPIMQFLFDQTFKAQMCMDFKRESGQILHRVAYVDPTFTMPCDRVQKAYSGVQSSNQRDNVKVRGQIAEFSYIDTRDIVGPICSCDTEAPAWVTQLLIDNVVDDVYYRIRVGKEWRNITGRLLKTILGTLSSIKDAYCRFEMEGIQPTAVGFDVSDRFVMDRIVDYFGHGRYGFCGVDNPILCDGLWPPMGGISPVP